MTTQHQRLGTLLSFAILALTGCDDDKTTKPPVTAASRIKFAASELTVSEMTRVARVPIAREGDISEATTVTISLSPGSAQITDDFSGGNRTITIAADQPDGTLLAFVVPDSLVEPDETFSARLESATDSVEVVEPKVATITITDLATDFHLTDVNANSPSHNAVISPRGQQQKITAWYFGHAG